MGIESLAIKISAIQAGGGVLNSLFGKMKGLENTSSEIKKNFKESVKYLKGAATAAVLTSAVASNLDKAADAAGGLQTSIKGLKKELISPEKSLAQVNKELTQIEDTAFSIQAKTPFDQGAVIEQATILKKAGLDVQSIAGGALEATALLATVEGMNPETAASIQAVGNSAFNLADQAGGFVKFADLMSRGSSLAYVSVEDLGESFKYAGGVAQRLGFDARETTVAIAALATGGIKASQGGTTFASIFSDLGKKKPDLIFDKVTKKALSMQEIINNLNKEFEGLTDKDKTKKMNKIFGAESAKGVGVLISNYARLNSEIDKQASLTSKVDVVLEGYEAKIGSLKGTAKSTIARLFTPALEPLSAIVDKTNEFVTAIGEATKGENELGEIVTKTSAGALVAGGLTTVVLGGLGLGKLTSVLKGSGGLKNLLRGGVGTASGIAKGKAIEKATGVQAVFVTNAAEIGGGTGGGVLAGAAGAGVFAKVKGWFLTGITAIGSAVAGSALAVGSGIGLALGGAVGLIFGDEINSFMDSTFPKVSKFLDDILPKFGPAKEAEERLERIKENGRQAEIRFRKRFVEALDEARKSGNEAEVNRLTAAFNGKLKADKIRNNISIQVDATSGKTIVDGGKSNTNVTTNLNPALD